jgi:hypothetical protein
MNQKLAKAIFAFVVLLFPLQTMALLEAKTWLKVEASDKIPQWKLRTIERAVRIFLGGHKEISFVENEVVSDIRLNVYVTRDTVTLQSRGQYGNVPIATSVIALKPETSLEVFRHHVFRVIKPFIQTEGLLQNQLPPADSDPSFLILAFIAGCVTSLALAKILSRPSKKHTRLHSLVAKIKIFMTDHALLISSVVAVFGVSHMILESVRYHSVYEQRITSVKAAIESEKRLEQEKKNVTK